jgi:uncharacterized phage protein gp47/JayE
MAFADLFALTATGFKTSDYTACLEFLKEEFRTIYGQDVYLEPDSQDGQLLAVYALALYDAGQLAASVYNSFSPATAIGTGLSRNVKINGIARQVATNSTADVRIVGQIGTVITDGQVEDNFARKWDLPASVTIPAGGEITVTATAVDLGAISAAANTLTKIATPTLGWQTVTNLAAATEGAPVESDAALRIRQATSTAQASLSVLDGLIGAVANVDGVTRYRGYENDSGTTDGDGIPAHSIGVVVAGGDNQAIADAIATKKTPGTRTYGTTSVGTVDEFGMPNTINFYRPTDVPMKAAITIQALAGYSTVYADLIKTAVADSINALQIGDDVLITRLYVPANLAGQPEGLTFNITALQIAKVVNSLGVIDVPIAFNEAASCLAANVTITVI